MGIFKYKATLGMVKRSIVLTHHLLPEVTNSGQTHFKYVFPFSVPVLWYQCPLRFPCES